MNWNLINALWWYRNIIYKKAKKEWISPYWVRYIEREQLDKYDMIYINEINQEKYGFKMGI